MLATNSSKEEIETLRIERGAVFGDVCMALGKTMITSLNCVNTGSLAELSKVAMDEVLEGRSKVFWRAAFESMSSCIEALRSNTKDMTGQSLMKRIPSSSAEVAELASLDEVLKRTESATQSLDISPSDPLLDQLVAYIKARKAYLSQAGGRSGHDTRSIASFDEFSLSMQGDLDRDRSVIQHKPTVTG